MSYIDHKFKDNTPEKTVEQIRTILSKLDMRLEERWKDSGITFCHSLHLYAEGGRPYSNGKGITEALARASAHGELIERLQNGLFCHKFQSVRRWSGMDIQRYAPDGKFMTVEEVIENGDWMDQLIQTYGGKLSRKSIADQCRIYACADDGKILTLPFYSLFEDKYVYLPIAFIDQMYTTNGCCAGNTKEEAWIHGFSEIMERHATARLMESGRALPRLSRELLDSFPTVKNILTEMKSYDNIDVTVFDASMGSGFPVISTRIINKKTGEYHVNVAADPVLEIAIERTLTESMQGKNLEELHAIHNGQILADINDYPPAANYMNQLRNGNGLFTADYFAEELTCDQAAAEFPDNSGKTNKELLPYMVDIFCKLGKPVYIRDFSYLGFPSYRIVVPGYSETMFHRLVAPVMEYAMGDQVSATVRNLKEADPVELNLFLKYTKMTAGMFFKLNSFSAMSGTPLTGTEDMILIYVAQAYAAYKLGAWADAIKYAKPLTKPGLLPDQEQTYFACVAFYLDLKSKKIADDKIRVIVGKFFETKISQKLYEKLDADLTPYEDYLFNCDPENCTDCKYAYCCKMDTYRSVVARLAPHYSAFTGNRTAL